MTPAGISKHAPLPWPSTNVIDPERDADKEFKVMTISQTGKIRERIAGKGRNPPRWIGTYFQESPGTWYAARAGDIVYSSIDLWKGCMGFVTDEFDGALVTKEFPKISSKLPRMMSTMAMVRTDVTGTTGLTPTA